MQEVKGCSSWGGCSRAGDARAGGDAGVQGLASLLPPGSLQQASRGPTRSFWCPVLEEAADSSPLQEIPLQLLGGILLKHFPSNASLLQDLGEQ